MNDSDNKQKSVEFIEHIDSSKFNSIDNILQHLRRFTDNLKSYSIENAKEAIFSMARDDSEREQIEAMCEENILSRQRLHELREARKRGISHAEWLEGTIEKEMKEVYPDITEAEINEVKEFIQERFYEDINENTDALEEEMEQTENLIQDTKGGNNAC